MDSRKINILNAIIEAYIDMPVPVGSRTLSKDYNLGVSSATIRNEMADLEDLGLLNKPHQSAGRVPSNKAYRFYVDEFYDNFMPYENKKFSEQIKNQLMGISNSIEEFYKNTVNLLAEMTNCTSYLVTPQKPDRTIKRLTLVKIDKFTAVLILVGDKGVVERHLLEIQDIDEEDLLYIEKILNENICGLDFEKIESLKITLSMGMAKYGKLISDIINLVRVFNKKVSAIEIYYDGLTNILNFDEYKDLDRAREFMSLIEDRDSLLEILSDDLSPDRIDVIIGDENEAELMKRNTIIRAPFMSSYKILGSLGIIGPVRIDYPEILKTVQVFSDGVQRALVEMQRGV